MLSLKKSFGSLLDQVLLSGLNFGIAFLLIRGITKSEYGLYVQLWMIGLLATVILDALLGNSFNILNNRPANIRPENLLKNTHWLSLVVSLIASAFGFICSLLLTADWASWVDRLMLAVAYIFYLFFMIGREFKRLSFYLTDDWRSALLLDALFAFLSFALLCSLWWFNVLSVDLIFVALGVASLFATVFSPVLVLNKFNLVPTELMNLARESWILSRWALPGAILGWGVNNAYLFVLGLVLGVAATAEANASKLTIMPLVLTLVAWYQISRSDISRMAQAKNPSAFKPFFRKSLLLMYLPLAGYIPAFLFAYQWIDPFFIGKGYTHMDLLIIMWFISAVLAPVKSLGSSMLVGFEAFKPLFKLSASTFIIQILGVVFLAKFFGLQYVLLAIILVDVIEISVMWLRMMPKYLSRNWI